MTACCYCGHATAVPLYDEVRDRLGVVTGSWRFSRCEGCGSALLQDPPTGEALAAAYPKEYGFRLSGGWLAQIEYSLFFRPMYRAQVGRITQGVGWRAGEGRRVLDVGCGTGLRLLEFRERGFEVAGVDFQEGPVAYVRDSLGINARCLDAKGLGAAFPKASFDLIVAFHLLEHVEEPSAVLGACRELLKPGGWLAIALPFGDSLQAAWLGKKWVAVTEAPRHVTLPSRAGVRAALRAAGFSEARVIADPVFACAALIGLSLFPGGAITQLATHRAMALANRAAGALASLASVPWVWAENTIFRRPAQGIVLAQLQN